MANPRYPIQVPRKKVPDKEVVVSDPSDLTGDLLSDVVYLVDGVIDMGASQITVPQGGLHIIGLGFGVSKLITTASGTDLFIDDGVFSGDLILDRIDIEVSGVGSRVWDLDNDGNGSAVECGAVNFLNCTEIGPLDSYRQGLFINVALINCVDGLTMSGTWSGGWASLTSIIVKTGLPTFTGTLFRAGPGLLIQGRFRSDMNAEGLNGGQFCDFSPANIESDGRFQMTSVSVPPGSTAFPNMPASSVKARFRSCDGTPNTYVGGQWKITVEAATTINTVGVIEKVAGTTGHSDLQHFTDGGGNNSLTYIGTQEVGVEMLIDLSFTGPNNNELVLVARHWVDADSAYFSPDLAETGPFTLDIAGRSAPTSLHAYCTFNNNDRFEVWVKNLTTTGDVTAKLEGIVSISERSS